MKNLKMMTFAAVLAATALVGSAPQTGDADSRNVKVGEEFTVTFDSNPSTPVQWYVLSPLGPSIELVSVKNEQAPQKGPRMSSGRPGKRIFTFKATDSTGSVAYMIRFVNIDFSNKIYDSKRVTYTVAPK